MYQSSAEYGAEYYPTLVWIMTILHTFFQSKRNLNTVETTICWTKNMWQNDLRKPFQSCQLKPSQQPFLYSIPASRASVDLTDFASRPFCSWETGEEEGFIRDGLWVSRQRQRQVLLPKEKWWKHIWSFFLWKTLKNIDVLEICLYWLWNMIGRYSTTEVWWGRILPGLYLQFSS